MEPRKLDLGDLYAVDMQGLGVDIYKKASKGKKDRRICFFNEKGCKALALFVKAKEKG